MAEKAWRGKKRTNLQKSDHRKRIAELRLRGHTADTIAEKLGLARSTVCLDIKAIEEEWKAQANTTIEERQQTLLRQIDQLKAEVWDSWEMSRCSEDGEVIAAGDARFITAMTGLIEKELKIILPRETGGKDGATVVFTDSQFEALLKRRANSPES
jgi:orotate phosphoribosyltransferase-like protein